MTDTARMRVALMSSMWGGRSPADLIWTGDGRLVVAPVSGDGSLGAPVFDQPIAEVHCRGQASRLTLVSGSTGIVRLDLAPDTAATQTLQRWTGLVGLIATAATADRMDGSGIAQWTSALRDAGADVRWTSARRSTTATLILAGGIIAIMSLCVVLAGVVPLLSR